LNEADVQHAPLWYLTGNLRKDRRWLRSTGHALARL